MNYVNKLYQEEPYSLNKKEKSKIFSSALAALTLHHYKNCGPYKKIIKNFKFNIKNKQKIKNFPMIPVRLFKKYDLKSVPSSKVIKKLVSSGTTGDKLSKIYLDKKNAKNQIRVLQKIMQSLIGKKRLPMLIIDQDPKLLDKSTFNARAAAIYGFSLFGANHCYLLNKDNKINYSSLSNFLKKYGKNKFFMFGFTSVIFENLLQKFSEKSFNFKNGILLHGGGWKKLEKIQVNNNVFKKKLFNKLKLKNVYNYYGLVEQTGSIFIECKCGYFSTSNFSDILIRDKDFNIAKNGKKGLIQLISLLPTSYPGHNILTEDIGEIIGEDTCKCGTKGKYFLVHGRAKEAEIRGCSDTR